jgi:predicted metalloprotease with PDZ domain
MKWPNPARLAGLGVLAVALAARADPALPGDGPLLDFQVAAGAGAAELSVEGRLTLAGGGELAIAEGLEPFVDSAEIAEGVGWQPLQKRGGLIVARGCAHRPCRIRYRVRLAEAAQALRNKDQALAHEGVLLSPPSAWLLRPWPGRPDGRYRFRVQTPAGIAFATGVARSADTSDTYEAPAENLLAAPYSAFGPLTMSRVTAGGGTIEVAMAPGERTISNGDVADWVQRSAVAVAGFYGRFPVSRTVVFVLPGGQRPVGFGTAMGGGGASIIMWIGRTATEADLHGDWTLIHEMAHLGLPNLPRRHRWMEEGLATYVEPVARVRLGLTRPEEFWSELMHGLPRGQLRPGEVGFDDAGRWGTTYWGGALFWFLADLEIRERTDNRRSVEDALRGIQQAGGSIGVSWPLEKVLAAGDSATGVPVLQGLYQRLGRGPSEVDLASLWERLGVERAEQSIRFRDGAPLAPVRRAITSAPGSTS